MKITLWDTRKNDAQKDFAGGMGVGMFPGGGGLRGELVRRWYRRDYRPVAMAFAYLAAIFRQLGHAVQYVEDELPESDLFVFHPSLLTLSLERAAIEAVNKTYPHAKVLVVGPVAHALPDAFRDLRVTIVKGEPEQLRWKLDEVLETDSTSSSAEIAIGSVKELDELPIPDWSAFAYRRFRIKYDFWKFPTALIQQSRGCTFTCNYCPYIMIENKTRFRAPEAVADEMRFGMKHYGFRSFKFRDPLFGLDRKRVLQLAELIGKLPKRVQFSVETRIDLMKDETLLALKDAGLTSITVGIETPDEGTLKRYKRAPVKDDRQRSFVARCRQLGIRTVAGFMIGFPEDTADSIYYVLDYARRVNPTYANFNVVTPYPGTEFYAEVADQIADRDWSKYSVYNPVLKYEHLTSQQVSEMHARCFGKFYFRSRYLKENAHLLWPSLQMFGMGRGDSKPIEVPAPSPKRPRPATEPPVLHQIGSA
ncbi:MAG: radical SAM protein [Planctomycetota bacterium]